MPDQTKIYPRSRDNRTVYLKNVIRGENIEVGDYTIYNDFAHDPQGVRTKQRFVSLSRQRGQAEDRKILLYRLRREVFVHEREPCDAAAFHLYIPDFF